jgi:hypothetical protein
MTQRIHVTEAYADNTRKLAEIRALVTSWAAGAFGKPDDQRAQVMGECATLILMVIDP